MKKIIYFAIVLFLFSCKKEKIEPVETPNFFEGKLKRMNDFLFYYDSTEGYLNKVNRINSTDTLTYYLINRENNRIVYFDPNTNEKFFAYFNADKRIKSIKRWDELSMTEKPFYKINFSNQLQSIEEPDQPPVYDKSIENFEFDAKNCIKYIVDFIIVTLSTPTHERVTVENTFTSLSYDKYAPNQQALTYNSFVSPYLDIPYFLGFDNYYIINPNQNLLKTSYAKNYDYEFNNKNQLIKSIIEIRSGFYKEFAMEYY